jgi:hypothetical protein
MKRKDKQIEWNLSQVKITNQKQSYKLNQVYLQINMQNDLSEKDTIDDKKILTKLNNLP